MTYTYGGKILLLLVLFGFMAYDVNAMSSVGLAPVTDGSCSKDVTVQNDINMTAFLGLWYEEMYLNKDKVTGHGKCGTLQFSLDTSGIITATYLDTDRIIKGELTEANPAAKNGKLQLSLNIVHEDIGKTKKKIFKYWIMDTDYKCYALVYTCIPGMTSHNVAGLLLVRDNDGHCLDDEMYQKIKRTAEDNILWNFNDFKSTNRIICTEEAYRYILKRQR